jgi:hypothetical protein
MSAKGFDGSLVEASRAGMSMIGLIAAAMTEITSYIARPRRAAVADWTAR